MDKYPGQPGPLPIIQALGSLGRSSGLWGPWCLLLGIGSPWSTPYGAPLLAPPGCKLGPNIGPSSLAWVSPPCIRWQTSWFQSQIRSSDSSQKPTNFWAGNPAPPQRVGNCRGRERWNRREGRGGGRGRREARKGRSIKRSRIWLKPQGKTF